MTQSTYTQYHSFGLFRGERIVRGIIIIEGILAFFYCLCVIITNEGESIVFEEDGIIEYSTALFYLVSSFILLLTLKKSSAFRRYKLFLGLFAVGFFIIAMEEISWGQRIFGWETEGWFLRTNAQGETNVHNVNRHKSTFALWGVTLLFGVIIPYISSINRGIKSFLDTIGFPIVNADFGIFFMFPFLYFYPRNHWTSHYLTMVLITIFILVVLNLSISKKYVQKLPPKWGPLFPLLFLPIGTIIYWVNMIHIDWMKNAPDEMKELLIGFAFLLFAITELFNAWRNPDTLM